MKDRKKRLYVYMNLKSLYVFSYVSPVLWESVQLISLSCIIHISVSPFKSVQSAGLVQMVQNGPMIVRVPSKD